MDRVSEFLKKELQGFKSTEITGLLIVVGAILFNYIMLHDSKIAVVSAICGILYTVIAGKGKISCYIFGLTGSGFYAYLSFINNLWGNCLLYLCYYIPMQILGILNWKNHLKKETNEIYKTGVNKKDRGKLVLVSIMLSALGFWILKLTGDSHPLADGISTSLSLVGMYLTVKRCIEQWVVWTIVNLITVIMWFKVVSTGMRAYSTILMWSVYLVLGIYFYVCWKKELLQSDNANI